MAPANSPAARKRLWIAPPVLILALTLVSQPRTAAGQTPSQPSSADIPRAADGHPDLSGTWDAGTLTPLLRPLEHDDTPYLTREQALEIETRERGQLEKGREPSDPNRTAPPVGGAAPFGLDETEREIGGAGNVGGYNNFWIDRGDAVFEIDGKLRTSIITRPANGLLPPVTPAAKRRIVRQRSASRGNDGTAWWLEEEGPGPYDDPELRPLAERCLLGFGSTMGPPMLPVLYNNHKTIVQTADHVMILVEMNHDARIVRIDAEHAPGEIRSWLGDSVGHWEGETLVVVTRNFRNETGLFFATGDLRVLERFTRLDADTLHYEFIVDDPSTWTEPWRGDYTWRATDDRVYEYACHEGNYALGNILRGARLLEGSGNAE